MRRPNVLLITSDQEQHRALLPEGMRLPGHDRLYARGTAFDGFHVVTTPCGPSRSVIYTGQHTSETGMVANPSARTGLSMSESVPTLGSMLRRMGYYTAYKGKWHLSTIPAREHFVGNSCGALEEFGFAEFNDDGDHPGEAWDGFRHDPVIAADAANWLLGADGRKPADTPWLLAVNFVNPHDIMFLDTHGGDWDRRGWAFRQPPRAPLYLDDVGAGLPSSLHDGTAEAAPIHQLRARLLDRLVGPRPTEEQGWLAYRNYYYNCLRDMDRHLQTVLDALDASGHTQDTIVVYATDHGEFAGAHGFREKAGSLYREVINVPLVVCHPDLEGGAATDAPVSALDIVPTILDLVGADRTLRAERFPQLRGTTFAPVLDRTGQAGSRSELLLYMTTVMGIDASRRLARFDARGEPEDLPYDRSLLRGIVTPRWKFGRYFSIADREVVPGSHAELEKVGDLELFDRECDPTEEQNLAHRPEHAGVVWELASRLQDLVRTEVGVDDSAELLPFLS